MLVLCCTSGYILELAPLLLFIYPMSFDINYYIQKKKSHQTVGLQEWFVQVNQRVLKQKILDCKPKGGWLATQSTPLDQPLLPCTPYTVTHMPDLSFSTYYMVLQICK